VLAELSRKFEDLKIKYEEQKNELRKVKEENFGL
jgi:hypothetical protein